MIHEPTPEECVFYDVRRALVLCTWLRDLARLLDAQAERESLLAEWLTVEHRECLRCSLAASHGTPRGNAICAHCAVQVGYATADLQALSFLRRPSL